MYRGKNLNNDCLQFALGTRVAHEYHELKNKQIDQALVDRAVASFEEWEW
jgi:hypothetical protein